MSQPPVSFSKDIRFGFPPVPQVSSLLLLHSLYLLDTTQIWFNEDQQCRTMHNHNALATFVNLDQPLLAEARTNRLQSRSIETRTTSILSPTKKIMSRPDLPPPSKKIKTIASTTSDASIVKDEVVPIKDKVNIHSLPPEMMSMVESFLDHLSVLKLNATTKKFRDTHEFTINMQNSLYRLEEKSLVTVTSLTSNDFLVCYTCFQGLPQDHFPREAATDNLDMAGSNARRRICAACIFSTRPDRIAGDELDLSSTDQFEFFKYRVFGTSVLYRTPKYDNKFWLICAGCNTIKVCRFTPRGQRKKHDEALYIGKGCEKCFKHVWAAETEKRRQAKNTAARERYAKRMEEVMEAFEQAELEAVEAERMEKLRVADLEEMVAAQARIIEQARSNERFMFEQALIHGSYVTANGFTITTNSHYLPATGIFNAPCQCEYYQQVEGSTNAHQDPVPDFRMFNSGPLLQGTVVPYTAPPNPYQALPQSLLTYNPSLKHNVFDPQLPFYTNDIGHLVPGTFGNLPATMQDSALLEPGPIDDAFFQSLFEDNVDGDDDGNPVDTHGETMTDTDEDDPLTVKVLNWLDDHPEDSEDFSESPATPSGSIDGRLAPVDNALAPLDNTYSRSGGTEIDNDNVPALSRFFGPSKPVLEWTNPQPSPNV
jgi:hypothetical protein